MNDCVEITLKNWRASAFKWGVSDCMLSIADYVLLRDGVDFGAKYRGTYDNEAGAYEWIRRIGSEAAMIDESGLLRASDPIRGDIVLIDRAGVPMAGLCTGNGVALRLPRGVAEIDLRFVKVTHVWR